MIQFTFTLENGTGFALEQCKLTAPPLEEGGQIGGDFGLGPGETKIMTYRVPLEKELAVQPEFTFFADGTEQTIRTRLLELP